MAKRLKSSLPVAYIPYTHSEMSYGHGTHSFGGEASGKGPLPICRDPLLHFIKEEHELAGGKVIRPSSCKQMSARAEPWSWALNPGLEPDSGIWLQSQPQGGSGVEREGGAGCHGCPLTL